MRYVGSAEQMHLQSIHRSDAQDASNLNTTVCDVCEVTPHVLRSSRAKRSDHWSSRKHVRQLLSLYDASLTGLIQLDLIKTLMNSIKAGPGLALRSIKPLAQWVA